MAALSRPLRRIYLQKSTCLLRLAEASQLNACCSMCIHRTGHLKSTAESLASTSPFRERELRLRRIQTDFTLTTCDYRAIVELETWRRRPRTKLSKCSNWRGSNCKSNLSTPSFLFLWTGHCCAECLEIEQLASWTARSVKNNYFPTMQWSFMRHSSSLRYYLYCASIRCVDTVIYHTDLSEV